MNKEPSSQPVLLLENVHKTFTQGKQKLKVLNKASLIIEAGEVVALVGPSGSGKSTLLQIAGLLDREDTGKVKINGIECAGASDKVRTQIRSRTLGFVYQFHHLLPEFSALENVMIPQMIAGVEAAQAKEKAHQMLKTLGLSRREEHRPTELSGGEQQRVAIARALVNGPSLLLADEPTGNLDPNTADEVFNLMLETAKEAKLAMLIVTHNLTLAKTMDRAVTLEDGQIVKVGKL